MLVLMLTSFDINICYEVFLPPSIDRKTARRHTQSVETKQIMSTIAQQKPLTKREMRKVFERNWGEQSKLARELGIYTGQLSQWLLDKTRRTRKFNPRDVERRALELLEREKQDQAPAAVA